MHSLTLGCADIERAAALDILAPRDSTSPEGRTTAAAAVHSTRQQQQERGWQSTGSRKLEGDDDQEGEEPAEEEAEEQDKEAEDSSDPSEDEEEQPAPTPAPTTTPPTPAPTAAETPTPEPTPVPTPGPTTPAPIMLTPAPTSTDEPTPAPVPATPAPMEEEVVATSQPVSDGDESGENNKVSMMRNGRDGNKSPRRYDYSRRFRWRAAA